MRTHGVFAYSYIYIYTHTAKLGNNHTGFQDQDIYLTSYIHLEPTQEYSNKKTYPALRTSASERGFGFSPRKLPCSGLAFAVFRQYFRPASSRITSATAAGHSRKPQCWIIFGQLGSGFSSMWRPRVHLGHVRSGTADPARGKRVFFLHSERYRKKSSPTRSVKVLQTNILHFYENLFKK